MGSSAKKQEVIQASEIWGHISTELDSLKKVAKIAGLLAARSLVSYVSRQIDSSIASTKTAPSVPADSSVKASGENETWLNG